MNHTTLKFIHQSNIYESTSHDTEIKDVHMYESTSHDPEIKDVHMYGIYLFPEECVNQFIKIYSIKFNLKHPNIQIVLRNSYKSNSISIGIRPIILQHMNQHNILHESGPLIFYIHDMYFRSQIFIETTITQDEIEELFKASECQIIWQYQPDAENISSYSLYTGIGASTFILKKNKKKVLFSDKLSKDKIFLIKDDDTFITLEDYSRDEISIKWNSPKCVTIIQKEDISYEVYYKLDYKEILTYTLYEEEMNY